MNWARSTDTKTPAGVEPPAGGSCCRAQELDRRSGAAWSGSMGRYTYARVLLLHSRNQQHCKATSLPWKKNKEAEDGDLFIYYHLEAGCLLWAPEVIIKGDKITARQELWETHKFNGKFEIPALLIMKACDWSQLKSILNSTINSRRKNCPLILRCV